MKERELFAALAMQELLRWEIEIVLREAKGTEIKKINIVTLSKNAYLLADEMVKVGDRIKLPEDIENIA